METSAHPDRFTLDLLALGDLEDARLGEVEAHLESCTECRERLWRVRQEFAGARRQIPERAPIEAFRERSEAERRRVAPWAAAAAGWAAAACVLLVWSPWSGDEAAGPGGAGAPVATEIDPEVLPTARAKGHFAVSVLRARGKTVDRLGQVAVCQPGDQLQFEPDLPDHGYFRILNVQDDGQVAAYLPQIPVTEASAALDFSVTLDEYAGGERIYFVWSDGALDDAVLEREVRDALALRPIEEIEELPLPRGTAAKQRSLLIYKGEAR